MNQISLRIAFSDGTFLDVTTSAGDIVKWEAKFDLSIDKLSKVTHLLFLAWVAVTRQKKTSETFDGWVELVSNIEVANPKD
jgi:hypothetical protein